MKVLGLGYVGINTTDLAAWTHLATQVLGARQAGTGPDESVRFRLDERTYRLSIHHSQANGLAYTGWELMDRRALDQAAEELTAAGVAFTPASRDEANTRGVGGMLRCLDPAGNPLELFYGALEDGATPFVSTRPGLKFVTGEQGLGHVVYAVGDDDTFTSFVDFYSRVLGFQMTDFMVRPRARIDMTFLGCNSRHHSTAVMRAGFTGFQHMMLEVEDLASVGQAYDLCQDGTAPVAITLGQHWNDRMTSFFVTTPSGFTIEYGWGGRQIDRATHAVVQSEGESVVWGHRFVRDVTAAPTPAQGQGAHITAGVAG